MGNNVTAEERDMNLSVAAENGEIDEVNKLLRKGADPNRKLADGERTHRTSLHRAAKTKNNVDVLTKLLTYIKDVDATDDAGNTALHLAAGYYNNAAVVQTLIHAKPNCKIQNHEGRTALHSAVHGGSDLKVIEMLLLAGSDPDIPDFDGNTSLHLCAAKKGSDDIIAGILLRFGANPNIKNQEGQTPLHVAAKAGNKIVLLLLKYHAKVRVKDKKGRKASELTELDDIKAVLEYEEQCLAERTVRSDIPSYLMSPRSQTSDFEYGNHVDVRYNANKAFASQGNRTHFWAGDTNGWKEYGGDAVFHLPDKSDLVVPPQALPSGTVIKLTIKPSKDREEELPEFDFDQYEFELGVKVDLPGAVLTAPWMAQSTEITRNLPLAFCSPQAFAGMSAEGRNCWRSSREVACQPDGVVALHFNLSREKTKNSLPFKIIPPNQTSAIHVVIDRPRSVSAANDDAATSPDLSLIPDAQHKGGDEYHSDSSSLSSEQTDDFKEKIPDEKSSIKSFDHSLLNEEETLTVDQINADKLGDDVAHIRDDDEAIQYQDESVENAFNYKHQQKSNKDDRVFDENTPSSDKEANGLSEQRYQDEDRSKKDSFSSETSEDTLRDLQNELDYDSTDKVEDIENNAKNIASYEGVVDEVGTNEPLIVPKLRTGDNKNDILTDLARLRNDESQVLNDKSPCSDEEANDLPQQKNPDEDHSMKEQSFSSEDDKTEANENTLHDLQNELYYDATDKIEDIEQNSAKNIASNEDVAHEVEMNESLIVPNQRTGDNKSDILTDLARLQADESRYQHPIDPALATIAEDAEEHVQEKSIISASSSSTESSGDELTAEDLLKFQVMSKANY